MTMENKPEMRFSVFNENWKLCKLGDITSSYSGGTPQVGRSEYYNGEIPFIRSGEINSEETELSITRIGLDNSSSKLVRKGDILYALYGATSGEVSRSKIEGAINQAVLAMLPHENYDANFIVQWLITNKNKIISTYLQGGQGNLSGEIVKSLILYTPSYQEQVKIGQYFEFLDNTITLQQRKLEILKNQKKAFLEKMFPKEGENVPEIRFSGFSDAWKQRKLCEFVNFYNGLTYKPEDVNQSGTFVLRSSNVKNGEILDADNVYVNEDIAKSEKVQLGDIIVVVRNGSRDLIGKHATVKRSMPNTVIGAFMTGIRSKEYSFVNVLLDTNQFEKEINKNLGATINQITGYMFSNMTFTIPSEEEQHKIGAFFTQLDNTITLQQRKLEILKNIKKSFLQKMFV